MRLLPAGNLPPLSPCKLTYDLVWNQSMKAGTAEIVVSKDADEHYPDDQLVTIEAKTVGMARIMYSFDVTHRAIINRETGRPVTTSHVQKAGKNARSYKTLFTGSGAVTEAEIYSAGMLDKKPEQHLECSKVHDLVTTVFYVRDVADKCEDQIQVPILAMDQAFLANFRLIGQEDMKFLGKTAPTWKLQLALSQPHLVGKSHTEKVQSAYVWFSDDELRLPVEIRAEAEMGTVDVKLTGYKAL